MESSDLKVKDCFKIFSAVEENSPIAKKNLELIFLKKESILIRKLKSIAVKLIKLGRGSNPTTARGDREKR